MRSLGVVLEPERVELPLLRRAGPLHRLDGPPLEGPVHPLVRPVLLRRAGVDALVDDPLPSSLKRASHL